ncbi:MAG: transposase, partial [Deltaproteobacteria bacterium]|nr:transposase [Deltaproteobacteria bacterium]
ADSDGKKPGRPKHFRDAERRLARERRKPHKCRKGSKNRNRQRKKMAGSHLKVRSQRKDFLEKESRRMANASDAALIVDIDMHGMAQAPSFGRSVADNGFGMFRNMLGRKPEEQGKKLVAIDRFHPPSRTCSGCGAVKDALGLSERVCMCDSCGHSRDRDENAALNIRTGGLRLPGIAREKNRRTCGVSPDADLAGLRRHTGSPWALTRGMSRVIESATSFFCFIKGSCSGARARSARPRFLPAASASASVRGRPGRRQVAESFGDAR